MLSARCAACCALVAPPRRRVLFTYGRSATRARQNSASAGVARRLSLARRGRHGAVRRQGEAPSLARAQLRHGDHAESVKTRALMLRWRPRDDRRAERSARADPRSQPDQGVPPEVQHRAARRQVVSVHQGHGRRAVSARMGDAASRRRRQPLLRSVHRRRRDAPRAQRGEADLHRSLVQFRHAAADAGAAVSRLLHQAVQGAVHSRADAGRVSRDDRRGARLSRRTNARSGAARARADGSSRPSRSTSSAPRSCATRCSISSTWRSRPSCSRSKAAIATWSDTRATAMTPSLR